jgi:transcriptional repressor NrdR
MVCIYCGGDTTVKNSRVKKRNNVIWRRRACGLCGAVATTFEQYDLSTALIVKKRSGRLQAFQRDKLLLSIAKSLEHRNNSSQAASELTNVVISDLLKKKPVETIISTIDISHVASLVLKRYDAASAIKYLSFQAPTSTARDVRGMLR